LLVHDSEINPFYITNHSSGCGNEFLDKVEEHLHEDEDIDETTLLADMAAVPTTPGVFDQGPPIDETLRTAELAQYLDSLRNACNCESHRGIVDQYPILFERFGAEILAMTGQERRARMYITIISNTTIHNLSTQKCKSHLVIPLVGPVCQAMFLAFWKCRVSRHHHLLAALRKKPSLLPSTHGNCGNSNGSLPAATLEKLHAFLLNLDLHYGETKAMRSFARHDKNNQLIVVRHDKKEVTYLPSFMSKSKIVRDFREKYPGVKLSLASLYRYWIKDGWFPHLKIRSPSSDECDECMMYRSHLTARVLRIDPSQYETDEQYSTEVLHCLQYDPTNLIDKAQHEHRIKAFCMRDEYEKDIASARDTSNPKRPIVLAFDFSQNLGLPHSTKLWASAYFQTNLSVNQFGIVDEEHDIHTHFLYHEGILNISKVFFF
jgi:hypothetical protein